MAIPERMIPVKVSSKKIRELAQKAKEILAAIDSGASEEDAFLKDMIDDWNSQVVCPCEFSDFRDYSSWTNANEFTRIAFNLEKFYEDFTWEELVQTISCVCDQKSNESEKIFALLLLEKNFHGNTQRLPDAVRQTRTGAGRFSFPAIHRRHHWCGERRDADSPQYAGEPGTG